MPGYELIGKEERQAINELFDDGGVLFAHGFDNIRNGRYRVREFERAFADYLGCLLYTSPSPRDGLLSRRPSSA